MIKKPFIACLATLGLLVLVEFFLYSCTDRNAQASKEFSKAEQEDIYYNNLSFANEPLPVADGHVIPRVKRVLKSYHYRTLRSYKLHHKASKWFPVMEPILTKYGIPEDFKYIPLVESGLQSGTSAKGASGLWQFMPHTARAYGLKVNGRVDERHQIEKSTIAACKYLRSLYREFNSWTLVATAYNIGENKLKRVIRRQDQDNYFRMRFNPETAVYVYKLVAMKEIIERPASYGYHRAQSPLMAINTNDQRYLLEYLGSGLSANMRFKMN